MFVASSALFAIKVNQVASLDYGHNTALLETLLTYLAIISVIIWVAVLATAVLRLAARLLWYRQTGNDKEGVEKQLTVL